MHLDDLKICFQYRSICFQYRFASRLGAPECR